MDELWTNLMAGRCSVGTVPPDRWSMEKHFHPRPKEPGKSYVWSAGVLDDVWGFDPAAFGISPREAEQMDPHQRLLLELTWEALENAGIRRSSVAGTDIGVFVGASSTEYQNIRGSDMAAGDAYTATGGALSIISNRISHAFDFRGPSFTVDTACSSSLVAMHQAMEALQSGRIDTAIVGGINLLLSPFGFIIFSQASMLSPNGLCRTFDAKADGYVRAEGGVVLVLKSAERAARDDSPVLCRVAASGVNSDGRTNGIALPSRLSQAKLLREVYSGAGIEPSQVAFVEAHGTGTRVGDPIEANTIGEVLGRDRKEPLRIGSIKSNIGHLEPASGLAGVLKAMLALEHDTLPPSINFDEPNPDIPFEELGLSVCTEPTPLGRGDGVRYAGVNSFGFGGTNAHVVIADAPATKPVRGKRYNGNSDLFALSAGSQPVIRDLARRYVDRLSAATFEQAREIVAAAAHRREMMGERVVVEWGSPRDLVRKLERVADKESDVPGVTWGTVTEPNAKVAFVFSGNGGQWPGMGRGAYAASRRFRETFDEIDALFDAEFGWSITEALFAPDLEQRLRFTHIAQPLIFSIQIAVARALIAEGLEPAVTVGHSVGEIAAATISGALTLRDAVRVIHARSAHQEVARDAGRMAVVVGSQEQVTALADEVGGVDLAAYNSPRTFTVAGPTEQIAALGHLARKRRVVFRQLDLDYPFHCALVDPVRAPLLKDLADLPVSAPKVAMISTVTGEAVEGASLDAEYWWRNVREPVRFAAALEAAAGTGARIFVEIGPRSVLLSNVSETLDPLGLPFAALGVLERREPVEEKDPIRPAVVAAFTRGAAIELEKLFGPEPTRAVALPTYAWHRRDMRTLETAEAVGSTLDTRWHRLLGARHTPDGVEWHNLLDTAALPELADHEVGGQPILPGAAFVEMALAVGRSWFPSGRASLLELDIVQPLALEPDRSKEVMARLSPNTNTLEIMSRQRLSKAGWHLHAIARLSEGGEEPITGTLPAEAGTPVDRDEVYRAAETVGLRYGPAFRLLRSVTRTGPRQLVVALQDAKPAAAYGIDPARLDACFHGLFSLFRELGAEGNGVAYIPVRFGHSRLAQPGALPTQAVIDLRQVGERSIVADFTLFDGAGTAIGHLHDARFQGARVKRLNLLSERALSMRTVAADRGMLGASGSDLDLAALPALIGELGLAADEASGSSGQLLVEGWAASAAFELAGGMAKDGILAAADLAALEPRVGTWLTHILHTLQESGLADATEDGWRVAASSDLPPADAVLAALIAESPDRSAEFLLAHALTSPEARAGFTAPAPGAVDGFELGGAPVRAAGESLLRLLERAGGLRPTGLRVLQVGYGPLTHALAEACAAAEARLTVLETDRRRLERGKLALRAGIDVVFAEDAAALAEGGFDLILSAEALHRQGRAGSLSDLRRAAAPGAAFLVVEASPSLFRDLVLGLSGSWFDAGGAAEFPLSPLRSAAEWAQALTDSGFGTVAATEIATGPETAILLAAAAPRAELPAAAPQAVVLRTLPAGPGPSLAAAIGDVLAEAGHALRRGTEEEADAVNLFVAAPSVPGDVAAMTEVALTLRDAAESCARAKAELWVLVPSRTGEAAMADPVAAGILAFARTLANETAGIVIRRVSIAAGVPAPAVGAGIASLLAAPQAETDFEIGREGCRVLRVEAMGDGFGAGGATAPAATLERGTAGGLSGLGWRAADRASPGPGEVEIAVEATGLNFRDVMWAMSLLPDDILEDGFAGPTLGLECAGRVASVGAGVTRVRAGDRVLSFAPSAFTTSVAVPESVVAPVPDGWTTEAAASVPVAFLTAYYGLVTLANLKAGEWVLIHGAAGGVGLAAVQIAQWRGANIVATAGSPEKRHLLRTLGVEHVLNSRSAAFADDIRAIHRPGVDIVLNSLSGEAMERGLGTLRPFGRFIELGKRDYVANTRIGLRPFRKNLSYFGVDVDQLLSDRDRASEIFGEIMALFATGDLRPLPYRVYSAEETVDAFRLMQQSGHIGKILLRPPAQPVAEDRQPRFAFAGDRTHLITGGFGGFGLETARWLADQGVRHLVLVGRSGPRSPEAQALVDELVARGVDLRARQCDVSDEAAVAALLAEVRTTMPPLAGVLHAAMVLEDGLATNLTAEQMTRVLEPKVDGAAHLDRLTAADALDYFVMFSSITTFIGNPGQGAYVAANGYLEGLARLRRERGLPGLALAWGAIADVGVLARQKGLAEALSKRVGVKAMPARDALDLMAQALARTGRDPAAAVLAVGSLDWGAARRLPALTSPTFAALTREGSVADAAEKRSVDLKALVAAQEPEAVRKQVIEVIVDEIATVLRIPKGDVAVTKRLSEIGLDSLMAIELATALQDRFELDAPPTGSVGALTTAGLADHLIGFVHSGSPDEESRAAQAVNDRHAGIELASEELVPLMDAVQARSRTLKGLMN